MASESSFQLPKSRRVNLSARTPSLTALCKSPTAAWARQRVLNNETHRLEQGAKWPPKENPGLPKLKEAERVFHSWITTESCLSYEYPLARHVAVRGSNLCHQITRFFIRAIRKYSSN